MIAICCYNIALFIGTKIVYVTVNKWVKAALSNEDRCANAKCRRRAKQWDAMSKEERDHYLSTTTDKGNKRLDFRFSH